MRLTAIGAAIAMSIAGTAAAGTLETLGAMKITGATDFNVIDQTGPNADAIRANLKRIKMPEGFKIDLYAVVPDARHMAVGPQGIAVFVGTRKTDVWVVTDRNKDRVADEVKDFAPSLPKSIPNGPCFSPDGFLYIAERNRVLVYPAAEFFYESPDVVAVPVIAEGALIPPDEESYNHTARVCRIGPDGKLYITLGQPFNVSPPEKLEMYRERGIGGIIRINTDGSGREVYAVGVRNSVGMDFNPANGELWFTDNQVDGMGDNIPPGELNRATGPGQQFGHPWYGGGSVRTHRRRTSPCPRSRWMRTPPIWA
jgi:glucose/arabinose dehydrogenase